MSDINYGLLIFCLGLVVLMALMWLYIIGLEKRVHRLDRKLYEHLRHDHQDIYRYSPEGEEANPMWIDRAIYDGHRPRPAFPPA